MKTYLHTQSGPLIVWWMLVMTAAMVIAGFWLARQCFIPVPILLLTGWLFHSLTIEITGEELCWYFGPGIIAKRVRLAEITSARVVQTTFLEGWGIHWSRFGWLYNIAGRGAVAVVMQNGKKLALGTDEPEALASALQFSTGKNNADIIKPFKAV